MIPDRKPFAAQLRADLPEAAVRHVLAVFQSEMETLTRNLRDSAAIGDPVAFSRIAHRIAGSASAVGAAALEQGARRAMKPTMVDPGAIAAMAAEIDRLSAAARGEAAATLSAMG